MSLLEIAGLSKVFGGFAAVNDVSFSVEPGAIHAVIGPNGAGKTTLFNLITGHLRPSAGRIVLAGAEVGGRPPHATARMGLNRAFQVTNVFPSLSVWESVECAARPSPCWAATARVKPPRCAASWA